VSCIKFTMRLSVAYEKEPSRVVHSPARTCRFPLLGVADDRPSRNFFNSIPKHSARLALPRASHLLNHVLVCSSLRCCLLSMLPFGRCLARALKTFAPATCRVPLNNYSTISASHREQVTIQCRSNGHITLRQVGVVNSLTHISLNVSSTSILRLRNASF
jgi:hypothetical protein